MTENKEKTCNHSLAPSVFFGDRALIDLIFKQQNYEFIGHNGNPQNVKLQFCTKCGQVIVKIQN